MTRDQQAAFDAGRAACDRLRAIGRPEAIQNYDPRPYLEGKKPYTPELGMWFREGVDLVERAVALQLGVETPGYADLIQRMGNYRERVAQLPDPEDAKHDPKARAMLSAIEAVGEGLTQEMRDLGVPEDDLLPDQSVPGPEPEDEYFARGFIARMAELKAG